jgi:hypothetical protein
MSCPHPHSRSGRTWFPGTAVPGAYLLRLSSLTTLHWLYPSFTNVAFSRRRACGRLRTSLRLCPLKGGPLASVIGQLQRLKWVRHFMHVSAVAQRSIP